MVVVVYHLHFLYIMSRMLIKQEVVAAHSFINENNAMSDLVSFINFLGCTVRSTKSPVGPLLDPCWTLVGRMRKNWCRHNK